MGVARQKKVDLIQEFIPIRVKGQERVVEVPLEDSVRAIHGAVADGVDHIVSATDVIGCSGAGFQTPSIKTGDEKNLLPHPDGILEAEKLFDQGSLVLNPFNGDMRKGFKNGL